MTQFESFRQFINYEKMRDHFYQRTNNHRSLVLEFFDRLPAKLYNIVDYKEINEHDMSKFEEPEFTPYVFITEKYRCIRENIPFFVDEDMELRMYQATIHHVKNNKHHPEFWSNENVIINFDDRDKPQQLINAENMPNKYIIEMVCDWCAVSKERNTNPFDWAKNNINIRWKFSKDQEQTIYNTLNSIWRD